MRYLNVLLFFIIMPAYALPELDNSQELPFEGTTTKIESKANDQQELLESSTTLNIPDTSNIMEKDAVLVDQLEEEMMADYEEPDFLDISEFDNLPIYQDELNHLEVFLSENPPFNFRSQDGVMAGIFVDLLKSSLQNLQVAKSEAQYHFVPWARGLNHLNAPQETNVLFATIKTPERADKFKWVGPIMDTHIAVFALRTKNITITSDSGLKFYRFGVIHKDISKDRLLEKGVLPNKIQASANFEAILKKMEANRIDLFVVDRSSAKWLIRQLGFNPKAYEMVYSLSVEPLYYAFNKSVSDETIQKMQEAVTKQLANRNYMKDLIERYRAPS